MRNRVIPVLVGAALLSLPRLAPGDEPAWHPPWGRDEAAAAVTTAAPLPLDEDHAEVFADPPASRELFWARTDYLLWWTKNGNLPVLITQGQSTDPLPGALGQAYTRILYGGNASFQDRNGARFTFGMAVGRASPWSVEGNFFFLDARQTGTTLTSNGTPILARPFFDVVGNQQNSSLVTYPGVISGSVAVANRSYLQGGEGNVEALCWSGQQLRLEALAGFRYLGLVESLDVSENTQVAPGAPEFGGTTVAVADHFGVRNSFYGGQLGLRSEVLIRRVTIGLVGKLALGDTMETVDIRGQTTINSATPTHIPAGLLALASNSGTFTRNAFAVVPELGLNVGVRITPRLTALVGYTFIYWSRVVRPGDQVDTSLNPNLVPTSNNYGAGGPQRPSFAFHETDYWAQGVNLGMEFRY